MDETTTIKEEPKETPSNAGGDKALEEMMEAGLHFGHKKSKTHPKMKPYVNGVRNTIHIINLEKTQEKLAETLGVLQALLAENKVVLFIGTRIQLKTLVKETAEAIGMPYVTERWIGGLLTNFEEVSKRIAHLKDLEAKKANEEEWGKYTKWEQHEMDEERKKLEEKFGGVKSLEKLPAAVFVFDLEENTLAVKEARQKGILILAIADTNTDPTMADHIIPANNDAVSAVQYLCEQIKQAALRAPSA